MTFHYALVDDLLPREEFDRRVEEVMEGSGDLLDEPTAAMIVVRDLGRSHVKIRDLGSGSSLSCFFGKVVSATSPREFQKSDGSTGLVADILLGDETGQVRVVLWDERALATGEVEVGEVLEVIAKPSTRGKGEVSAMAFRKAACEISCAMAPDRRFLPPEPVKELEARVIEIGKVRAFTRRDGSEGRMVEAVIGNPEETSRLVCWAPELLGGIQAGSSVRILGASRSSQADGEEFQLDEKGEVTPLGKEIEVPTTDIGKVPESGFTSVKGVIRSAGPLRSFTTRRGHPSSVRNLTVSDGSGEMALVLWGEKAALDIAEGDAVTLYRVQVRRGRDGGPELHTGRGSAVVLPGGEAEPVELEGIVIPASAGACLEIAGDCRPVGGDLPMGRLVRLRGRRVRRTILPTEVEVREPDPAGVRDRLARFRAGLPT
jgi:replication factor A1